MEQYDEFWDAHYRDTSDLAVIVAGDICEKHIDIRDYLKYQDDLDTLTVVRFCLLLGAEPNVLDKMTPKQIQEYVDVLLHKKFNFYDDSEHSRRFLLQLIQYPFARWGPRCLWVESCSVDLKGMADIKAISEKLSAALGFKYFTDSRYLCWPIF